MANTRFLPALNLKTNMALAVTVFILLTAAALTLACTVAVQKGMEEVIFSQQAALIKRTADDLDEKFAFRAEILRRLANDIPVARMREPGALQTFLEQHHSLDEVFTNLYIVDTHGDPLANLDFPKNKFNVAKRAYFQETMSTRRGLISAPLISPTSKKQLVIMTSPLLDNSGEVILLMLATIDVQKDSFIGDLARTKIGKGGYFFIITSDGTFVTHPDGSRILKNASELEGRSTPLENALAGKEGTFHLTNRRGIDKFYSFKRLKSVNWIVGAVYPSNEALAPLLEIRTNAFQMAILLIAVIGPLAWWYTRRQISPLQELRTRIQAIQEKPEQFSPQLRYPKNEIGYLALTFDNLMRKLFFAEQALRGNEERLRLITNNLPVLIGHVDKSERFTFANQRYGNICGVPFYKVPGMSLREVLGPVAYAQSKPYIEAALAGRQVHFERLVQGPSVYRWDSVTYVPDVDADGVVIGLYSMVEDITERRQARDALLASASKIKNLEMALDKHSLVSITDAGGRISYVNDLFCSVSKFSRQELEGQDHRLINSGHHSADFMLALWETILSGDTWNGEIKNRAKDGSCFWVDATIVPSHDGQGKIEQFIAIFTDVTERKRADEEVRHRALHDLLTNLPNRSLLSDRLQQALAKAKRNKSHFALIYLDLDRFKEVNDTLGHAIGDLLLKDVAMRMQDCMRHSDTVARVGGDEFVILLSAIEAQTDALAFGEKIRTVLSQPFEVVGNRLHISSSIGIAIYPDHGIDEETLSRNADQAMYQAKKNGRDNVRLHKPSYLDLETRQPSRLLC